MDKNKWIVVLPALLLALFAAAFAFAAAGQEPQARPPATATGLVIPLSPETGSWQVTVTGQAEGAQILSSPNSILIGKVDNNDNLVFD
jgi:hypothetical protein